MKPSEGMIQISQELTLTALAKFAARCEKIPYNKALLSIKHTQLYKHIMECTDPLVAAYPFGAIKEMYKAEKRGDMDTYEKWFCNY